MNKEEISCLLPKNKFDNSNIAKLINIGFPELNCVLNELLFWVTDYNWPIAPDVCSILVKSGEEIIPEIKKIFIEQDHERIWYLVKFVLPRLDLIIQDRLLDVINKYKIKLVDKDYISNVNNYLSNFVNN